MNINCKPQNRIDSNQVNIPMFETNMEFLRILSPSGGTKVVRSGRHVILHEDKCIGCGFCMLRCNFEALEMKEDSVAAKADNCFGCGLCVSVCPVEALRLVKREDYSVMPDIVKDITAVIAAQKQEPKRNTTSQ